MKKAVCVILKNEENKILGVSRKNNKTLFGLVGGKVDDTDKTIEDAIIRETKEETGLDIFNIVLIDERVYGISEETTYKQHCFTADWRGNILNRQELEMNGETGVVKWLTEEELEKGFFGEYNKSMFDKIKKEFKLLF